MGLIFVCSHESKIFGFKSALHFLTVAGQTANFGGRPNRRLNASFRWDANSSQ